MGFWCFGWPGSLTPEQINQLPPATSVSSGDLFPVDQSNGNGTFTTRAATAAQIVAVLVPPAGYVTMTQMKLALAAQGQLTTVNGLVPASITNATYIRWNTGGYTIQGDSMSQFIQASTSPAYTNAQMTALYALAATEPA